MTVIKLTPYYATDQTNQNQYLEISTDQLAPQMYKLPAALGQLITIQHADQLVPFVKQLQLTTNDAQTTKRIMTDVTTIISLLHLINPQADWLSQRYASIIQARNHAIEANTPDLLFEYLAHHDPAWIQRNHIMSNKMIQNQLKQNPITNLKQLANVVYYESKFKWHAIDNQLKTIDDELLDRSFHEISHQIEHQMKTLNTQLATYDQIKRLTNIQTEIKLMIDNLNLKITQLKIIKLQ